MNKYYSTVIDSQNIGFYLISIMISPCYTMGDAETVTKWPPKFKAYPELYLGILKRN